jgi:hypothetical protein
MSARLNMNKIADFSWKGTTFNQITPVFQQNHNSTILTKYNLKLAQPLKIYRKEIASTPSLTCSRQQNSIEQLNRPNGYIISNAQNQYGLVETLDFNLTNNTTELPGTCPSLSSNNVCLTPAKNALNRVRSSGNLKKAYNVNRNNDTYYTSAKQYLESRNKLFAQNQFNYIRKGDLASTPGDPTSYQNIYSPQGLNHCPKISIRSEITFQYQWTSSNGSPTTVSIPPGNYQSVSELNQILIQTMTENQHYYTNNSTGTLVFLLNISYDNVAQRIVLQTTYTSTDIFSSDVYVPASEDEIPTALSSPYFIINSTSSILFGFNPGNYPSNSTTVSGTGSSSQTMGQFAPQIGPPIYVPLYYKPSNYQYANQGAVSASDKIVRLKYNTITTNAFKYRTALGNATGNALAYNTSGSTYTLKDKMGYPNKCTPVFNNYTDTMQKC